MAVNPNKLSKFWQELKRRRVVHVTIVYASAAILIIDLVGNVTDPLHLPEWTPTLIIVLLAVGFPVALIFSWIFDVTPEGIEKTKPVEEEEGADEISTVKPKLGSNGWKIATYVSVIVLLGVLIWHMLDRNNARNADLSVAILPVKNLSGDTEQQFMCDGLTREIISQLYLISSFEKVVPFQTILGYKDSDKSTTVIAEELGVDYILDLSYKKVGTQINVTGDLVNAKEDNVIWHHDYPREYKLIMSLQNDIALEIADKLNAFMTGEEESRVSKIPTNNLKAYELVQKAVDYFFSGPPWEPGFKLRDSLEKAIELDPDYASPYVLIATFSLFKYTGLREPLQDFIPEDVFNYNNKALKRDPENTSAILNQALYEQWVEWNYVESEAQFQKVFSIEPNTRNYYFIRSYIEFLYKMDRCEEVPEFMERLDGPHPREAQIYDALDRHEMAETIAENSIIGESPPILTIEYFIWEGKYDVVRRVMNSIDMAHTSMYNLPDALTYRALAYYYTGDKNLARELVKQLKLSGETDHYGMPELNLGRYYSVIGEVDSAFFWLEKAYKEHCVDLTWLRADQLLRKLDVDARYWDLYARTGFKAYDEYRDSIQAERP